MSFDCKIIADSLSPQGDRLTTFVVTYPRMIHSEMCRHRMFSRNTASSRAIPFDKMVKEVEDNPFVPIAWQKDHKGMQGNEYLSKSESTLAKVDWLAAKAKAINKAKILSNKNVTKQLCNRLLEPFMWTTEIITSGDDGLKNFFKLRCPEYVFDVDTVYGKKPVKFKSKEDVWHHFEDIEHKSWNMTELEWLQNNKSQAEIHIQAIAELMWDAYNESTPKQLKADEWHIPFGDKFDEDCLHTMAAKTDNDYEVCQQGDITNMKVEIATARCARVSYLNYEGKDDYEKDIKLHDRLLTDQHMSPFEHCAKAMNREEYKEYFSGKVIETNNSDMVTEDTVALDALLPPENFGWCRNLKGFVQYREMVE